MGPLIQSNPTAKDYNIAAELRDVAFCDTFADGKIGEMTSCSFASMARYLEQITALDI